MDARKNTSSLIIGSIGLLLQFVGLLGAPVLVEIDPVGGQALASIIILAGIAMLIVGLGLYASAKGHHWSLGLLGLLSIIGLIILAVLPDRTYGRVDPKLMDAGIDQPHVKGGPAYRCTRCDYILNGVTTATCPECGAPFDANDMNSVRLTDDRGLDVPRAEGPLWTVRWSLICGILSLVFFCVPLVNFAFAGCGIGFGHSARSTLRKKPTFDSSDGVAMTGLILSYIGLAIAVAINALMVISIALD